MNIKITAERVLALLAVLVLGGLGFVTISGVSTIENLDKTLTALVNAQPAEPGASAPDDSAGTQIVTMTQSLEISPPATETQTVETSLPATETQSVEISPPTTETQTVDVSPVLTTTQSVTPSVPVFFMV